MKGRRWVIQRNGDGDWLVRYCAVVDDVRLRPLDYAIFWPCFGFGAHLFMRCRVYVYWISSYAIASFALEIRFVFGWVVRVLRNGDYCLDRLGGEF